MRGGERRRGEEAQSQKSLTEGGHFLGQVGTKSSKQAAIGQQVEGGVAPHGVEGEGVDSRWEASHVTHLLFPVGSHGDEQATSQRLADVKSSPDTWRHP